jgi:putative FmdB family regulatory protein
MPVYDHLCVACGPFEARRPMSESQAPAPCPVCRAPAPRMVSAPRLNLMSSSNRYAETRNEKSAHAPDVVHSLAPAVHRHGHSHHGQAHGKPRKYASHDPTRPWMLGH